MCDRDEAERVAPLRCYIIRLDGHPPGTTVGYDGTVTYVSVIRALFARMPDLEPLYREQFSYLDGEELPYVVFGAFLIPVLETALESHDDERVRSICAYLEEVAVNANTEASSKRTTPSGDRRVVERHAMGVRGWPLRGRANETHMRVRSWACNPTELAQGRTGTPRLDDAASESLPRIRQALRVGSAIPNFRVVGNTDITDRSQGAGQPRPG